MKGYAMLKIGESGWIEKERPACGPLDAIVRPLAVAVCTSDVHTLWEGAIGDRHNMILGHEACGVIDEVGELIGFEPLESEECETAGGLLLTVFDRIPDEGDSVTIEDGDDRATFTVVDMDRHRIDKIRVVLEHAPESDES